MAMPGGRFSLGGSIARLPVVFITRFLGILVGSLVMGGIMRSFVAVSARRMRFQVRGVHQHSKEGQKGQ